ncbi:MAG: DUF499 domain-containing protein [Chloroflexi bacterium]|nr:DUF499 domain-containing protein [Chloroflexota bacterium]
MALKPWYQVVYPRKDLRENRPLDAAEFAVHLDQVRDGRAPGDYQDPARFFSRTYLTASLTDLAGQVLRRLSGERTEASAVFNLSTQFGGGKTHALTLLYHLGKHGPAAREWQGVGRLLRQAGLECIPKAATAVFVGTEFDSLRGRGGDDGTPLRRTPWGEIAYQLGGAEALAVLGEHEAQFIEPKGDVIRAFLPKDRPAIILVDEVINYVSTYRSLGYHNRMYNFLQALSETARGQDNVGLVVSIPASELEYTAEDEADEQRFKKMLDRVGKAIMMSAETETAEIIRRRLFEWDSPALTQDGRIMLSREARDTCQAYADWVMTHRLQLPSWFAPDSAQEAFIATYPFHPTVLSVFERKWQVLPRFQRTRGVLRLLALWVARAYQSGYRGTHKDPLLGIGTAPLDDPMFRSAVFEQLGEGRLEGAVTTDICGRRESHATRLDDEAVETIRRGRLHRQAAAAIFFESNGGQQRMEATAPEIRLAVAAPDLDIGNVEPVLEGLRGACYFLTVEGNSYRFSVTPNLNKLLADRRANIGDARITETIGAEVQRVFRMGAGLERVYFPETSGEIPDRPVLVLAVLAPDHVREDPATTALINRITREAGSSGRTFKSALLWAVPEDDAQLRTDARQWLAWELIRDEHAGGQLRLDDVQQRQLQTDLGKAKANLAESVWRAYKNVALLGKDNELRTINLGLIHSSAAASIVELILRRLRQDGEIEDTISPNFLRRNWPAFPEWSTRGVRDAFFASPRFPRLADPNAIRDTVVNGVREGFLAYVGKAGGGGYEPFYFQTSVNPYSVEISDDMYLITKETAEAYLSRVQDGSKVVAVRIVPDGAQLRPNEELAFSIRCLNQHGDEVEPGYTVWRVSSGTIDGQGRLRASQAEGEITVTAIVGDVSGTALVRVSLAETPPPPPPPPPPPLPLQTRRLTWSGEVPAQKWMNFYTRVLSRFAVGGGLKLTVQVEVAPSGGVSEQKVEETKGALRELGLEDSVAVGE